MQAVDTVCQNSKARSLKSVYSDIQISAPVQEAGVTEDSFVQDPLHVAWKGLLIGRHTGNAVRLLTQDTGFLQV